MQEERFLFFYYKNFIHWKRERGMNGLIKTIQDRIRQLSEEPVTRKTNPIPFAEFIGAVRKSYQTLFDAIQTLIVQHAIDPIEANGDSDIASDVAPVPEGDAYDIQQLALELLIQEKKKISISIATSDERKDKAIDSIFLLYMTAVLYTYMLKPYNERLTLEDKRATDYPYLIKNGLVRSQDKILSYRMSDLLAALYQLTARAKDIPYDNAFVEYLELLTIRSAQFINLTFDGWKHDVVAVRTVMISSSNSTGIGDDVLPEPTFDENQTEWEYQCNREASMLLQCTVCALYEKLSFIGIVPQEDMISLLIHETSSKYVGRILMEYYGINIKSSDWHDVVVFGVEEQWPSLKQANGRLSALFEQQTCGMIPYDAVSNENQQVFKNWIFYNLDIMDGSSGCNKLRENYLKLCLRPGDREKFMKEYPDLTCTDQNILSTYRATEYDKLREQADRTIEDVLQKEIDKRPEPLTFLLVLCDFLETFFSEHFYPLVLSDYVIFENELTSRITDLESMHDSVPIIVQVFNHFQLYYLGKLYRFDSFVCSVLAWLHIVQTPKFNKSINRVSIQAWYDELDTIRRGIKKPSAARIRKLQLQEQDRPIEDEVTFDQPDEEGEASPQQQQPITKNSISYASDDCIIVNGVL